MEKSLPIPSSTIQNTLFISFLVYNNNIEIKYINQQHLLLIKEITTIEIIAIIAPWLYFSKSK